MVQGDKQTVGGLSINTSGRQNEANVSGKKQSDSVGGTLLINEMPLPEYENWIEDKYGEDFDLQIAAEFLEPETYEEVANIQDKDQRRETIARAIRGSIENGTIRPPPNLCLRRFLAVQVAVSIRNPARITR